MLKLYKSRAYLLESVDFLPQLYPLKLRIFLDILDKVRTRRDVMSAFKEFTDNVLDFGRSAYTKAALGVVSLGVVAASVTGCSSPGVDPEGGGSTPGGNDKIELVTIGNREKAEYVGYYPADSSFITDQSIAIGSSSIKLKAVKATSKPINSAGFTQLVNADNIDIAGTTTGASVIFVKLKNNNLPLSIASEGNYLGQGNSANTKNSKIVAAEFTGARDLILLNARNNGKTPEENVENLASVLTKIQSGELKLELVGQKATGYGKAASTVYNIGLIAK